MKRALSIIFASILIAISLSACASSYFKVKDPASGNIYYTDKIEQEKSGAVKLKDSNTGNTVTLQSSEVTEIDKEEYKANTKKE